MTLTEAIHFSNSFKEKYPEKLIHLGNFEISNEKLLEVMYTAEIFGLSASISEEEAFEKSIKLFIENKELPNG